MPGGPSSKMAASMHYHTCSTRHGVQSSTQSPRASSTGSMQSAGKHGEHCAQPLMLHLSTTIKAHYWLPTTHLCVGKIEPEKCATAMSFASWLSRILASFRESIENARKPLKAIPRVLGTKLSAPC